MDDFVTVATEIYINSLNMQTSDYNRNFSIVFAHKITPSEMINIFKTILQIII